MALAIRWGYVPEKFRKHQNHEQRGTPVITLFNLFIKISLKQRKSEGKYREYQVLVSNLQARITKTANTKTANNYISLLQMVDHVEALFPVLLRTMSDNSDEVFRV